MVTKTTSVTGIVEEYLEAILNMTSEGKKVRAARLAERLQVSPPTVTVTLARMRRDGFVAPNEDEGITLTERGMKLALGTVRRHRLAERLLTDILKIPWHEVHQEACLLEHAISEKIADRLYEVLGRPAICPHGNPIPVGDVLPPIRGVPMNTISAGSTVVVERISEEANHSMELMEYFEQTGIKPGAVITVKEVAEYAGTMSVSMGKKSIPLGTKAAAMVWVLQPSNP